MNGEFYCDRSSNTNKRRRSADWQIGRRVVVILCVVAVAIGSFREVTLQIDVVPVNACAALMEMDATVFANKILFAKRRMWGKIESVNGTLETQGAIGVGGKSRIVLIA